MTNPFQHEVDCDPALRELAQLIEHAVDADSVRSPFGSVWAFRSSQATAPEARVHTPMLCVVAQGSRQILFGDERYVYDARHFFLNAVSLPGACQVMKASEDNPCLWMTIELDPSLIRSVIVESGLTSPISEAYAPLPQRAMDASPIDRTLLDAVVRLARLFDVPSRAGCLLYPVSLALREIVYHLLTGEQGARLRQLALPGDQAPPVIKAISWLRDNFDKPLHVETLAKQFGMSTSGFHAHFKSVTATTPLQFQKQLRLLEARRLMLAERLDAASTGFRVGYDDAAYFNRDYKRFFGEPPLRDIIRIRGLVHNPA